MSLGQAIVTCQFPNRDVAREGYGLHVHRHGRDLLEEVELFAGEASSTSCAISYHKRGPSQIMYSGSARMAKLGYCCLRTPQVLVHHERKV